MNDYRYERNFVFFYVKKGKILKSNVIENVVVKNRYTGCCVARAEICYKSVLSIGFYKIRLYKSNKIPGCFPKCDVSLKICYFLKLKEKKLNKKLFQSLNSYKKIGNFIKIHMNFILKIMKRVQKMLDKELDALY